MCNWASQRAKYDGRFKVSDVDKKAGAQFWRLTREEIWEEQDVPNHLQGSYGGDQPTMRVRVLKGYRVKIEALGTETKIDDYIKK